MLPITSILKIASNFHFRPKTANFGPGKFFFSFWPNLPDIWPTKTSNIDFSPKWADLGRSGQSQWHLPLCCKNEIWCKKNVPTWPLNQYFCSSWPLYVVNMGQNRFKKHTNKFLCQPLHNLTARTILLNKIIVKNDFIIAKFPQEADFVGFLNVEWLIKSPEWWYYGLVELKISILPQNDNLWPETASFT